jgi:hypothetical protein
MKRFTSSILALSLTASLLAFGTVAQAASSASSASSEGSSASSGSLSTSFESSSGSSSKPDKVAQGDYRVIEVAETAVRPGLLRVKLQAVAGSGAEGEFFLYLAPATVQAGNLATGQVVSARTRPYGVEFAQAATKEAFFLLLADEHFRDTRTKAVSI